ncbi:hypothetical protein AAEX63_02675 [Luteococcus sp. H138]|uniref:hypothetical protein n=1 Tax=unclassified Luteococcus TaxID=2639923 RepID=UPI00313D1238
MHPDLVRLVNHDSDDGGSPLVEPDTFAHRLGEAVAASPLTLDALSSRLGQLGTPVTIATLSYWRSSRSVPTRRKSLRAVEHLENLLGLAPGWLVSALPAAAADGWDPVAMLPPNPRLMTALDGLGLDLRRRSSTDLVRDRLQITPGARTHEVRQLIRVEADELLRVAVMVAMESGQHLGELEGLGGAVVEDMVELPAQGAGDATLVIARLELPRRLVRGERCDYGYRYRIDSLAAFPSETSIARSARTPLLLQEVTFHDELPQRVEYVCQPYRSAPDEASQVVSLPSGRSIQHCQRDALAGVHVIRWR